MVKKIIVFSSIFCFIGLYTQTEAYSNRLLDKIGQKRSKLLHSIIRNNRSKQWHGNSLGTSQWDMSNYEILLLGGEVQLSLLLFQIDQEHLLMYPETQSLIECYDRNVWKKWNNWSQVSVVGKNDTVIHQYDENGLLTTTTMISGDEYICKDTLRYDQAHNLVEYVNSGGDIDIRCTFEYSLDNKLTQFHSYDWDEQSHCWENESKIVLSYSGENIISKTLYTWGASDWTVATTDSCFHSAQGHLDSIVSYSHFGYSLLPSGKTFFKYNGEGKCYEINKYSWNIADSAWNHQHSCYLQYSTQGFLSERMDSSKFFHYKDTFAYNSLGLVTETLRYTYSAEEWIASLKKTYEYTIDNNVSRYTGYDQNGLSLIEDIKWEFMYDRSKKPTGFVYYEYDTLTNSWTNNDSISIVFTSISGIKKKTASSFTAQPLQCRNVGSSLRITYSDISDPDAQCVLYSVSGKALTHLAPVAGPKNLVYTCENFASLYAAGIYVIGIKSKDKVIARISQRYVK